VATTVAVKGRTLVEVSMPLVTPQDARTKSRFPHDSNDGSVDDHIVFERLMSSLGGGVTGGGAFTCGGVIGGASAT